MFIIVSRRHLRQPPLRIAVVRRAGRIARMARRMAASGFLAFQIRQACRLKPERLAAILADTSHGLWSPSHLKRIREFSNDQV